MLCGSRPFSGAHLGSTPSGSEHCGGRLAQPRLQPAPSLMLSASMPSGAITAAACPARHLSQAVARPARPPAAESGSSALSRSISAAHLNHARACGSYAPGGRQGGAHHSLSPRLARLGANRGLLAAGSGATTPFSSLPRFRTLQCRALARAPGAGFTSVRLHAIDQAPVARGHRRPAPRAADAEQAGCTVPRRRHPQRRHAQRQRARPRQHARGSILGSGIPGRSYDDLSSHALACGPGACTLVCSLSRLALQPRSCVQCYRTGTHALPSRRAQQQHAAAARPCSTAASGQV